ncbi:MAG: hypothetical protein Q9160_008247 [Pyrenula sp. 1 TL-2023]
MDSPSVTRWATSIQSRPNPTKAKLLIFSLPRYIEEIEIDAGMLDLEVQSRILQVAVDPSNYIAEVYTHDKVLRATLTLGEGRQRFIPDEFESSSKRKGEFEATDGARQGGYEAAEGARQGGYETAAGARQEDMRRQREQDRKEIRRQIEQEMRQQGGQDKEVMKRQREHDQEDMKQQIERDTKRVKR